MKIPVWALILIIVGSLLIAAIASMAIANNITKKKTGKTLKQLYNSPNLVPTTNTGGTGSNGNQPGQSGGSGEQGGQGSGQGQ